MPLFWRLLTALFFFFFAAQVLTRGRHTLQQGGAPLLGGLPDRRLLDALRRPEERQPDSVAQAAGAPAAVLAGLHPRLRQVKLVPSAEPFAHPPFLPTNVLS